MTENFTKVTKYVTKLKGTSKNYVWERSHLSFFMDSAFSNMIKNENPEMPEINRKLSKSKKHSVLTVYRYQRTAKKQSICYLSTILPLITKKATFSLQWYVLVNNFKQHFESCALITQNAQKSARNQINSLNTSKNEFTKMFCGFRGFEYALWPKSENPQMPEINIKLSKSKKHPLLMVTITRKLLKSHQFVI